MRSEEFERENKYLVLKWANITLYLSDEQKKQLFEIIKTIEDTRTSLHKNPAPTYVVVNEDEPYAEKVWELIKEGWLNDKGEK